MFRKLILSAVIATATLTGLTLTSTTAAAATPFARERDRDRNHRQFEVLVECGHRWENRGTFRDRFDAERVAQRLRHEGFRVEIREW